MSAVCRVFRALFSSRHWWRVQQRRGSYRPRQHQLAHQPRRPHSSAKRWATDNLLSADIAVVAPLVGVGIGLFWFAADLCRCTRAYVCIFRCMCMCYVYVHVCVAVRWVGAYVYAHVWVYASMGVGRICEERETMQVVPSATASMILPSIGLVLFCYICAYTYTLTICE